MEAECLLSLRFNIHVNNNWINSSVMEQFFSTAVSFKPKFISGTSSEAQLAFHLLEKFFYVALSRMFVLV